MQFKTINHSIKVHSWREFYLKQNSIPAIKSLKIPGSSVIMRPVYLSNKKVNPNK